MSWLFYNIFTFTKKQVKFGKVILYCLEIPSDSNFSLKKSENLGNIGKLLGNFYFHIFSTKFVLKLTNRTYRGQFHNPNSRTLSGETPLMHSELTSFMQGPRYDLQLQT